MARTPVALVATLALSLLAAPLAAGAQQTGKINRIGVFAPGSASGSDQIQQLVTSFREELRDLGVCRRNAPTSISRGTKRIDPSEIVDPEPNTRSHFRSQCRQTHYSDTLLAPHFE